MRTGARGAKLPDVELLFGVDREPDLRREALGELRAAWERVAATRTGEVVACVGPPGSGRTTLLAQMLAELSSARERPRLIAGGFGAAGSGLRVWQLAGRGFDLLPPTVATAAGLGHVIATAAAAAAIGNPAGAARTFTAIAAFVGQLGQATGYVAQTSGEPEREAAPVSASALLHAVQAGIDRSRPVVLVLDDADEAPSSLEWHSLFLDRWIAPLVRDYPLLVVISAHAGAPPDLSGFSTPTSTVRIDRLQGDDVVAWLRDVEPAVVTDLLACAGGHPGWTVGLFREWVKQGTVALVGGVWSRTDRSGEAARQTAAAYVQTVLWSLLGPDVEAYDRAARTLRIASVEGMTFTADAVAAMFGEDRDEMIDWLDARLVCSAGQPSAPLEEAGLVARPHAPRGERYLALYRFRSPLVWAALRSTSITAEYPDLPFGDDRELAVAYAAALVNCYGHTPQTPWSVITRLYRLAGNAYAASSCQLLASRTAEETVHQEVLHSELEAVQLAHERGERRPAARTLAAATRIIVASHALGRRLDANLAVDYARVGYGLAEEAAAAAPLDVEVLKAYALRTIAASAYTLRCYGDTLACATASRALWLSFPDPAEAADATIGLIRTYGCLLDIVRREGADALTSFLRRQLTLGRDVLPSGDPNTWGNSASVIALFTNAVRELETSARGELTEVRPEQRPHMEGDLCEALAMVAKGTGDLATAAALLQDAARHFEGCRLGALCPHLGDTHAHLLPVLLEQEKYGDAERAAHNALYVLVSHETWLGAAIVLMELSQVYANTGARAAAFEMIAHGLYVCRQSQAARFAIVLWSRLGAYLTHFGDSASLQLECEAMAAVIAYSRRSVDRHDRNELVTPALLHRARLRHESDGGGTFLEQLTGTSHADSERYLTRLIESAGEPPSYLAPDTS